MSDETEIVPPPPESHAKANLPTEKKAETTTEEYGRHKLSADIWASAVTLLVGLAWPATVLVCVYLAVHFASAPGFQNAVRDAVMHHDLEVDASKDGMKFKLTAQVVQDAIVQQSLSIAKTSTPNETDQKPPTRTSPAQLKQVADSAANTLSTQFSQPPETRMKILWVDDHPQNNVGLQYAFQALGMIVVCIDSNANISEAFRTASRFDVVITDMYRDASGDKRAEPLGGQQTVEAIRANYPNVPVIIYAGGYAARHASDPLTQPLIAITDDTQRVFELVFEIASKKVAPPRR